MSTEYETCGGGVAAGYARGCKKASKSSLIELGPIELGYPLNSATKSKSNHQFVTPFSTQPTVQFGLKGAELARGSMLISKVANLNLVQKLRAYDVPSSTSSD